MLFREPNPDADASGFAVMAVAVVGGLWFWPLIDRPGALTPVRFLGGLALMVATGMWVARWSYAADGESERAGEFDRGLRWAAPLCHALLAVAALATLLEDLRAGRKPGGFAGALLFAAALPPTVHLFAFARRLADRVHSE
ncbi:hypothetical protein [Alienimonas sp. DA493]|uniref:hypothetical protein n=1 Tax=Alienimonas sp. DA493 TaxID=3373605 RepID=UPI00375483E2